MIDVVEIILNQHAFGTNPNDGKTLCARFVKREDEARIKKAMRRLERVVEANDANLFDWMDIGVMITKVKKNASFNTKSKIIYSRKYKEGSTASKRFEAAKRYAGFLERRDPEYMYVASQLKEETGSNCYRIFYRYGKALEHEDKCKKIKRKIAGRKAAFTKVINKAKIIRKNYQTSLFPDEYKTDEKFLALLEKTKQKREQLNRAKNLTPSDIEDVTCDYAPESMPHVEKLVRKLVEKRNDNRSLCA